MTIPIFTRQDAGCYADSTFGHDHIRMRLADILELMTLDSQAAGHPTHTDYSERYDIFTSLRRAMPDDAWDENKALDYLNRDYVTADNVVWEFYCGDLCLVAWDQEEGEYAE